MDIYQKVNNFLADCFKKMELDFPKPLPVNIGSRKVLRYKNQTLEVAILQKLARYISGLNSSLLLLNFGFTQEVGVIFRTLDEFHEDIIFLGIAINSGERSKSHDEYLKNFYQEEFDNPHNPFLSSQVRKTLPRKNIHAALAEHLKVSLNPSDAQKNLRLLSQAYSGYVHGTSIHILEMINETNLKYFLDGMRGTSRQNEFVFNYWNYAYRGIITMMYVSSILGYGDIRNECMKFRDYFERQTGDTGQGDAESLLKKMKSNKTKI